MRSATAAVGFVILLAGSTAVVTYGAPQAGAPQPAAVTAPKFNPAADPAKDLEGAIAEARRTRKRIILDVGGEWCGWCHAMDRYYAEHADLMALREKHFIWLKVNFSPENNNTAFLSKYPAIHGYPHLFVLDTDGKLLHSQDTSLLEQGSSYNLEKMFAFLKQWQLGE
jgi:thiol:disulfide interchange protein